MLEFRSNNDTHRPVLDALDLIRRYADTRLTYPPVGETVPTHKGLLGDWTELVFTDPAKGPKRVVRGVYEICTFQALRDSLRCKEIWVVGAEKWRNPDKDLPADFEAQRGAHYAALRKPLDPTVFIDQLREEMRAELAAPPRWPATRRTSAPSTRTSSPSGTYGGRGVLIYWHVERKSMAIHSQLLTCTASEVAAMVEGAIQHGTAMEVEGNYVDSHGQSEIGFGITRLLGFDLLPRIKRINRVRLYRPAAGEPDAYPRLAPALTRPIRWDVVAEQYDQMIKYATAIRTGTASAEAILRRFIRANAIHPTYQAMAATSPSTAATSRNSPSSACACSKPP